MRETLSLGFSFSLAIFLFSSITAIINVAALTKQQKLDRISALPGQPPVTFSQFSGYVTVNENHGRALFYWLTEAASSALKKPLVLWLNGGPGCSSVAYGASEEIGPFRINRNGSSLYLNKYSWSRGNNCTFKYLTKQNFLSLLSDFEVLNLYANRSKYSLPQDALVFLIRWMSRFPQYKYREFYIAGESYAGHYVPQLAKKIIDYNSAYSRPIINLKGFIVGNAVTDNYYDSIGTVTFWWTHSMISDKTYRSIINHCNFSAEKSSKKCDDTVNYAMNHEFGDIDQYSIYTPSCIALPNSTNYAEKYYNRQEVQKALHANVTGIPYKWTACSDVLINNWKDSEDSVLPTYKQLIAAGLKIWVFSGDTDSVVPVTATRFSLSHLNLPIKTPWYPWYSGNQVGGWTEVYKGLTFATVRGAGHEVPLFQPRRALILFRSFLAGKQLPKSRHISQR
ncbi:serine carboxypeptidase 24 [Citrus sinensis]|uniref:Serine carboxypeptidase 24 n=1 Tax=Citrus sinensis TaxID=2711 RepID=A0ACB8P7F6_CITSI|nr:serine carboxypeptidase 24 [Citrus sinensis]